MRTASVSSFGSSSSFHFEDENNTKHTDAEFARAFKKYGKNFYSKFLQLVVQSRTNERHNKPCQRAADDQQVEWFMLAVDELGEVSAFLKKLKIDKFPPEAGELTVDFFLYTTDHCTLPLESWSWIFDDTDRKDSSVSSLDLYNHLGTLLKSCAVAARMTPMHRYYVKKQSADTFVILYRILMGPSTIDLGSDAKRIPLDYFQTHYGSVRMNLAYRTRMEIEQKLTPTQENTDSFQQISVISPGTTPGSECRADSFGSRITHFTTSPPSHSPCFSPSSNSSSFSRQPVTFKLGGRSRSTSLASEPGEMASSPVPTGTSPKDRSMSVPNIPKNMPFANLLTLSYTGALFPLAEDEADEQNEEEKESSSEESTEEEKSENEMSSTLHSSNHTLLATSSSSSGEGMERDRLNTIMKRPQDLQGLLPVNPLDVHETIRPEDCLNDSQQSTPIQSANTTFESAKSSNENSVESPNVSEHKNESTNKLDSDEDSFVKIPIQFIPLSDDDSQGALTDLISNCKIMPPIESFLPDDLESMFKQVEYFSQHQGTFDRFLAEVKEAVEADEM